MKRRIPTYFAALMGLLLAAGAGVVAHSEATVVSADGFGRTQITFTKWLTTFPNMEGVVGGDVGVGTYAGEILTYDPSLGGGRITKITADYHLNGSVHQSTVRLTVWQFNDDFAVLSGGVTDGWKKGAIAYGIYKVISCSQVESGTCFQGTLYLVGGGS